MRLHEDNFRKSRLTRARKSREAQLLMMLMQLAEVDAEPTLATADR